MRCRQARSLVTKVFEVSLADVTPELAPRSGFVGVVRAPQGCEAWGGAPGLRNRVSLHQNGVRRVVVFLMNEEL